MKKAFVSLVAGLTLLGLTATEASASNRSYRGCYFTVSGTGNTATVADYPGNCDYLQARIAIYNAPGTSYYLGTWGTNGSSRSASGTVAGRYGRVQETAYTSGWYLA